MIFLQLFLLCSLASAEVYFAETFNSGFDDRWFHSEDSSIPHGSLSNDQFQHCSEGDRAIKFLNGSSYYHISAKLSKPLNTEKSEMYFQYVFQYPESIGCGGAYVKLFDHLEPKTFNGESLYALMFGPDKCGSQTEEIHAIFHYKGVNYALKEKVRYSPDSDPHLLELAIGKDKRFVLKVDGEIKSEGTFEDNFGFLPPKMIDDPEDIKPKDWVDEPMMADPNDKKPEDWDDRKDIPDPDAKKPEDWDDEADGEWERDLIKNHKYKGAWAPKMIPNPGYKGKWERKQIPNPNYVEDHTFGNFNINWVGIDIWTVEPGTIFDDILLTDDSQEAMDHQELVMTKLKAMIEKKRLEQPKPSEPKIEETDIPEGDHPSIDQEGEEGEEEGEEHEDL